MKEINSLYIHFPFCKHLCNYCDFYKHKLDNNTQITSFEQQLDNQIKYHLEFLAKYGFQLGELDTIYIGGGTPSLWKQSGISYLKDLIEAKNIRLNKSVEFTIEVDPDTWTEKEVDNWIAIGVNRFSIGSQAFSEKYIKLMDRTHGLIDVEKTVKFFHERKLNYSVDLMLGLPKSEERDLVGEVSTLLKYEPNHISVYILKTRKNYVLKEELPGDESIRKEYLDVSSFLKEKGYDHYEVSNYARDGFYSKHNIKYWNYESVAGIGPNATGLLVSKNEAVRYQWKSVSLGVQEELLEGSSLIIEKLFLGLRFNNGFDLDSLFLKNPERIELDSIYKVWSEMGYLAENSNRHSLYLSSLGYLMCDSMIDDIFKKINF